MGIFSGRFRTHFAKSKIREFRIEQFTFKWPQNHLTPSLVTHGITSYAFPTYNMKDEMLHKVRRTNNIITEQSSDSGGFFIVRGT